MGSTALLLQHARGDNEEGMTQVVQTDDRIGLKPVVKRFQVFFVPCFTRYDSDLYGLRLNIVPMMVLWNPYDVKIGGKEKLTTQSAFIATLRTLSVRLDLR